MKVSSLLFAVVTLILVISLLSVWFYPSVQDFMASNTMWNGVRSFSDNVSADNIESLDELPSLPKQAVLVAIPYLDYTDAELLKIKQFLADGGTLLLMDDYGYGNTVLAYLGVGVRFSNQPLLDPLFNYKNQLMPRITDFASELKESGIATIVLNHATSLTNVEPAKVIAWSSTASFLDTNENGSWDGGELKGPFVVAAELRLGQGTLALVADPSIMINSMVGRDDNYGFIRYLTRRGDEQEEVLVDNSHLTKMPLDVSKTRVTGGREMLSSPYALLGITALIFVVVSRYTIKKGGNID
ncbi:MAG: hypothetical protein HY528_03155 [Chloroflexi bacterium]|nr:hypothetical protein [Chloroflexota bacterium]